MKLYKIILSCLLTTAVVLIGIFVLPTEAQAATSGTCGNNLTWTLDNTGILTISGTGAMDDWYSPSVVPWYSSHSSVRTVIIENGVTTIGKNAFRYFTNLENIIIGSSIKTIGMNAFYNCTGLQSVDIPNSVTTIGNSAFEGCSDLVNITIGNSTNTIGASAFCDCTSLRSITIPNSVITIGGAAFYNCTSLRSVSIPDSVTTIGGSTFYGCYGLRSVSVGNSVSAIDEYTFYKCTSLRIVTIGNSVTTIGSYAFYDCFSIESMTIGNSVISIDYDAFCNCNLLENVYYAGSQTQWNSISIGSNNSWLTNATIHCNHIHDYTLLPAVIVEPSCTANGYIEHTCAYGDTYREILFALGHNTDGDGVEILPTCTEKGYTMYSCTRCGTAMAENYTSALGHDYTGRVIVEPSCADEGYSIITCTRCGRENGKTDYTDALGHKMVLVPAVEPTCTQPGLSAGTKCERCDLVGVAQTEVAATGIHDYTANPTTCGSCGYVRLTLKITGVSLRASAAGLYFKGEFIFDEDVEVLRYGIAVSLENKLPVADDSDETCLYTQSTISALVANIMEGTDTQQNGKNARMPVYARAYALLEDGTMIYSDAVSVSLRQMVQAVDVQLWDSLTDIQKDALAAMYNGFVDVMASWDIPNLKTYAESK